MICLLPPPHCPVPNTSVDGAYITDEQARTQFSLWALMPSPLLITNNLLEASEYCAYQ
jgi:hypothetical protein